MLVRRRDEQELGRVRGAAGQHDDVGPVRLGLAVLLDDDALDRGAGAAVSSLTACAFVSSVTFGCSIAGRTPKTSASDLPCTAHGKPSQFTQRTQAEYGMFASFSRIPHGAWNGWRPAASRSSCELLDARLVRDGRKRVRPARRPLGRVLPARTVHLVELLGQRVVRLELVVGDRPRGRDAVVVGELPEVPGAQPVERRPVELGRPADEVVDLRLERLALLVVPGVLGHVAVVDEDVVGEPVGRLARQPVAALEQQDPLAGRRQVPRQRAAAGAAADDDHVVALHLRPPRVARGR